MGSEMCIRDRCGTCEKAFYSAGNLKRHMLTHSAVKSHKCGNCDKSFARAGDLKQHMECGEKSHMCRICGKAFTLAGNLRMHLHTHY